VRGRANGILGACGSIGAALPFIALAPALASPFGWRLIFVIGALPILILPLLFWKLRETPVWLEVQKRGAPRLSARSEIGLLLSPALRSRFAAMSGLWFIINFASAASAAFFTLYVVQERSWSPADIARLAPVGLAGSFLGFLAAGAAMDLIGRRWTVTILMIALGLLTQLCYYSHSWWAITVGFVGLQASLGIWVVAYTLNAELFPTELRAAASGWCHNLIGRWGVVLAPLLLGGLAKGMGGIGPAAIALSFVAFLAVPLVWLALPETRGRPLGRS